LCQREVGYAEFATQFFAVGLDLTLFRSQGEIAGVIQV
jgi:hypothetical protein